MCTWYWYAMCRHTSRRGERDWGKQGCDRVEKGCIAFASSRKLGTPKKYLFSRSLCFHPVHLVSARWASAAVSLNSIPSCSRGSPP
jgi:hypothetical protein